MSKTLPLFTIEQTVNTYKYLFKPNPIFGMDFFAEGFKAKDIVLLDDTKTGSQGIPIHFKYYALFLRLEGETTRIVNQFSYIIKPQTLQLVNPGSIYSFKDITKASRTFVLLFDKEFIQEENLDKETQDSLFKFHQNYQQEVYLDTALFAQTVSIYEQLSDELKAQKQDYTSIVKMLINQLLFLLKREKLKVSHKRPITRAEQISCEFLLLIEDHYSYKKSVKEYAKLLDITPKHLSETVQSTLHHCALSYINVRIIKEIQYLLCFSDMSIKQISHILNFGTLSQLGRFFKRHEGMSPKEYRLKNKVTPILKVT